MDRPTDIPVKILQPLAAIFKTAGNQALTILQLPSEETIRQYLIDNMPDQKEFEDFTSQSNTLQRHAGSYPSVDSERSYLSVVLTATGS